MSEHLTIGFLPLVDACLPILAAEHGFAAEEGLELSFVRDVSWATVLDRLLYGHSDAAHMLAPLAIATTLGRARPAQPLVAPFVLGLNGNAITFAPALAEAVGAPDGRLGDPLTIGHALATVAAARTAAGRKLRYWLAACGIRPDIDVEIATVAPPFVADALESGEIDGTCVGEPWNSVAVERGAGRIVLATAQIWRRGVEKVLALRENRLEERRDAVEALIRAMRKAGAHFIDPANWQANAAILADARYLGGSPELILRAISDRLVLAHRTAPIHYADFMFQYREAANFPWVSQGEWLYSQMARWDHTPFDAQEGAKAARVMRPDVYRSALAGTGDLLPGASSKVEGSLGQKTAVSAQQGTMVLEQNSFFDGRTFDPDDLPGYLSSLPG